MGSAHKPSIKALINGLSMMSDKCLPAQITNTIDTTRNRFDEDFGTGTQRPAQPVTTVSDMKASSKKKKLRKLQVIKEFTAQTTVTRVFWSTESAVMRRGGRSIALARPQSESANLSSRDAPPVATRTNDAKHRAHISRMSLPML
jgi:hypothetical protein